LPCAQPHAFGKLRHTEITDLYPGATVNHANDVWSAASRLALMDDRLIAAGRVAVSRYVADRRSDDVHEWEARLGPLSFTPPETQLDPAAWERVDPAFVGAMGRILPTGRPGRSGRATRRATHLPPPHIFVITRAW
jgi:hypothetical protein